MEKQAVLIQLNGESREVRDRSTLDDLVSELSLAPARIAIELNQLVVRRDKWAQTVLAQGDQIEIVHFVGGGEYRNKQEHDAELIGRRRVQSQRD